MRELDKEEKSPRYILFIGITGIVFLLLILKLFTLQILDASTYEEKALKNRIRTNVVKAARGEIYDREGKLLAKNTTGYQLVHYDTKNLSSSEISILREIQGLTDEQIEKRLFNEKKSRAEKLRETIFNIRKISSLTGYTTDYIITRFEKQPRTGTSNKILVIEDLYKSIALKAIEKLDNDKIDIVEYNKRYYPEDSIASHVIGNVKPISNEEYEKLKDKGYLNDDLIGKKGVEKQYDKEIKGQNGTEYVEVDVHGNIIKEIKNVESIRGKNIYLSIDTNSVFKNITNPPKKVLYEFPTSKIRQN